MRETITAVIPAKNEEKNIEKCIKSVAWCDKILVMWVGDDKTGEISRNLGAEVIEKNKGEENGIVGIQKNINLAIEKCETDWLLRIDADELVSDKLKKEIQNLLENPSDKEAYGIPRKQYFMGDFLKGGDPVYDRLVRLFKPKAAKYDPIVPVHEQLTISGKQGLLTGELIHYSHPTLNILLDKYNSYTSIEATNLEETEFNAKLKMILLPPYIFLRWMIWHKGYRDGTRGIIAGILRAFYDFLIYSKYLQRQLKLKTSPQSVRIK